MENQENIFKIANNIMSERNEKEFRRDGEIETPNRLNSSKTSSKEIMDKIRYVVCIFDFISNIVLQLFFVRLVIIYHSITILERNIPRTIHQPCS